MLRENNPVIACWVTLRLLYIFFLLDSYIRTVQTFDLPLIDTIDTRFDAIGENSFILFGPCMVCVINAINQVESCE